MSTLMWRTIVTVLLTTTLTFSVGFGQSTFGTILGTVRDQSGALIPGCMVTVENLGTSLRRAIVADERGSYNAPNLEPGTYRVRIEVPGFQVAEYTDIQLLARQTIRIDGALTVATLAETVIVTGEAAPVINTKHILFIVSGAFEKLPDIKTRRPEKRDPFQRLQSPGKSVSGVLMKTITVSIPIYRRHHIRNGKVRRGGNALARSSIHDTF